MCGIFGFALRTPLSMDRVFRVMEKLEVHKYPDELHAVGGYGAGLALLLENGELFVEKVGSVGGAPARKLAQIVRIDKASVLISHVRMPSPEFMETAAYRETAQPYVVEREPELTIASIHNGRIENYKNVRKTLGSAHIFESEKYELIDSEVIPHLFEETLSVEEDVIKALYSLFCSLQGSSAIAMLQLSEEESFLHLIHKGKTRGLTVWTNDNNEVMFCSRKEVLTEELGASLSRGKFNQKASIANSEEAGLAISYPLPST